MGFAVKQSDRKLAFRPIAQYYQDTLDKAVADITSGAFDYNTVLNRTVSEMTNSGLRTVDYASGWKPPCQCCRKTRCNDRCQIGYFKNQ